MTNILINLHKRAAGIDLRGSVARFGIDPYFRFTVDTTEAGSASGTFVLPTIGAGYDATVDWGDGTTTELIGTPGDVTKVYSEAKEYQISITGTFPRIFFNNGSDKLKLKSIDNWGNIQWQSFERAFYGCSNLVKAHGIADTSAVTDFREAFYGCSSLQTLDVSGWNTEKVTNFGSAFYGCSSLQTLDVSGWNTSAVTSFAAAFFGCSSLQTLDVSGWNTSAVTTFSYAFFGCSSLQTLDVSGWNTEKVTNFRYAFSGCSSLQTLDVSGWNTEKVTNFQEAFRNCSILKGDFSSLSIKAATNLFLMFLNSNINAPGTTTNYDLLLNSFRAQAETYSKTGLTCYVSLNNRNYTGLVVSAIFSAGPC